MLLFTKIKKLCRQDRGAVAMVTTLMLTAMLGLTGAAVDLGVMYSVHNELQNAADAAALAGASRLVTMDGDGNAVATPNDALTEAMTFGQANQALGAQLAVLNQDIEMGLWDVASNDFDPDHYGPSANPDYLTAVRVTTRKDDLANSPVSTYFASAVGLSEVNMNAESSAYLGYAGSVLEGEVDLPIAVEESAVSNGGGPLCGDALEFHDENDENTSWTTFFTYPSNDPAVKKFVTGASTIPAIEVGDIISSTNGNLSNNTFDALYARFSSEGSDTNGDGEPDYWPVTLPVYKPTGNQAEIEVTGFAVMIITKVNPRRTRISKATCNAAR